MLTPAGSRRPGTHRPHRPTAAAGLLPWATAAVRPQSLVSLAAVLLLATIPVLVPLLVLPGDGSPVISAGNRTGAGPYGPPGGDDGTRSPASASRGPTSPAPTSPARTSPAPSATSPSATSPGATRPAPARAVPDATTLIPAPSSPPAAQPAGSAAPADPTADPTVAQVTPGSGGWAGGYGGWGGGFRGGPGRWC